MSSQQTLRRVIIITYIQRICLSYILPVDWAKASNFKTDYHALAVVI